MSTRRDRLRLVSHFPGRLRVRAEAFRLLPEVAADVAERVGGELGVLAVQAFPRTGSLLVQYEPREIELRRLIDVLVVAGGLRGIEVDVREDWVSRPAQGARVRGAIGAWNRSLRAVTEGKVDLRTALPGTLVAAGAAMFLAGRRRVPEWYDLMFWAFVTFSNLNAVVQEEPVDGRSA